MAYHHQSESRKHKSNDRDKTVDRPTDQIPGTYHDDDRSVKRFDDSKETKLEIKNDGSFLEQFKKLQERKSKKATTSTCLNHALKRKDVSSDDRQSYSSYDEYDHETPSQQKQLDTTPSNSTDKPKGLMITKRRIGGARVLKTGVVEKKLKVDDDSNTLGKDGWSKYMAEVEKYKMVCTSEELGRPLIK